MTGGPVISPYPDLYSSMSDPLSPYYLPTVVGRGPKIFSDFTVTLPFQQRPSGKHKSFLLGLEQTLSGQAL